MSLDNFIIQSYTEMLNKVSIYLVNTKHKTDDYIKGFELIEQGQYYCDAVRKEFGDKLYKLAKSEEELETIKAFGFDEN